MQAVADSAGGGSDPEGRGRDSSDVTRLLHAYGEGDAQALDDLIPLVYDHLRNVARRQLRRERDDHTLTTTGLVHETFLELSALREVQFADRGHFFAASARTMRHILTDYAVRRKARKRGGNRKQVPFEENLLPFEENTEDVIALDQALSRLESIDARLVQVVECRFFAGLTIEETAEAVGISQATVSRDWTRARAWLNRELSARPG